MTDKANRTFKIGDGVIYAGPHMAIIKDGKVISTADLKPATFEECIALFGEVGAAKAVLAELSPPEKPSLCTGYRDRLYTTGNAFVCGAETVTADRSVVIGRRVIKDTDRSFVGSIGSSAHTGHYRFPEPGLIGYWRMLSAPGMPSPLWVRLRLTVGLAWRKAKRRLGLSYGLPRTL